MATQPQSGFTLIELVTTIGIIAIVASALAVFVVDNFRFQSMTITEGQSFGEAQRAVDQMKREIRGATIGENGAFPIGNAEPQALTIYTDIDFDNDIEQVRYFLTGTTFQKGVIEPQAAAEVYPPGQEQVTVVTPNIDNGAEPIFLYYDENYTGSETPMDPAVESQVRSIGIHMVVDNTPANDIGRYIVDTTVQLRNL